MPQTSQKSLPEQVIASPDDKAKRFVEWWRRMHQKPDPLVAVALKFVEWADRDTASQRFLWEVCRWSQRPWARSSEWTFVCWMIDGGGMWTKDLPSKRAAIAYFRQAPAVVMARSGRCAGIGVFEGAQHNAAS